MKKISSVGFTLVLLGSMFLTNCAPPPPPVTKVQIDEVKQSALEKEKKVDDLKKERMDLEKQIAEKQEEIKILEERLKKIKE